MSAWDTSIVRVDIPGKSDAEEYVRELSGKDLDRVMSAFEEGTTKEHMIMACILFSCDSEGVPIFTDEDKEKVASAPISTIMAVAEKGMEINGLDGEQNLSQGQ